MTASTRPSLFMRFMKEGLGSYESEVIACYLAALEQAPAGAVLDIGANIGLYSILASAMSQREVFGFEPTPELADLMRRVSADNELAYHTEQIAIGRENGTATLYLSESSDLSNSLAEGFRKSSRQLQVTVEPLDRWCERRRITPSVIKIDTETTEPDVIRGGLETLHAHRPWVFCEVLYNRVEDQLMELLPQLDYHWYHLKGDPPYEPQTEIVGDRTYQGMMWLFTPEPVKPAFWRSAAAWRAAVLRCRSTTSGAGGP